MMFAQTANRDHILHQFQCHKVHWHIWQLGYLAKQGILAPGSFANNNPCIQAYLTKKEARKKDMFVMRYTSLGLGHVVVAGTSNIFGLDMSTRCWHDVDTVNIFVSGSIGYVTEAYRICCMVASIYFFAFAPHPMRHVHKRALTSLTLSNLKSAQIRTLHTLFTPFSRHSSGHLQGWTFYGNLVIYSTLQLVNSVLVPGTKIRKVRRGLCKYIRFKYALWST